jgi:hypothetical protein
MQKLGGIEKLLNALANISRKILRIREIIHNELRLSFSF